MKLSNKAEVRISILLALATGEVAGLLHFFGHPMFTHFVALSLGGVLIAIPLLWIEWLQRRGISYFGLFAKIWICISLLAGWAESNLFQRLLIAGLPVFVGIRTLRKMLRLVDQVQQEAYLDVIRAEDNRIGRVTRSTLGLIGCIVLIAFMGPGRASPFWAIPLAVPITWFVWRIVFHLFLGREARDGANVSTETFQANQGTGQ